MLHTHLNLHVTRTSSGNFPNKQRSLRRLWPFDRKAPSVCKCILQVLLPGRFPSLSSVIYQILRLDRRSPLILNEYYVMHTLLTYLLTPWFRVLPEQLTGLQLVKKFPVFHTTRRFITALTSVRHLSLPWASPIQSIYPHPTSWRSILILSTHLRLSLPSGLFPSGFLTKILYTPLSSPIGTTCPTHLILLDFITRTILGEEYKSFSSSLCNLLQSSVTSRSAVCISACPTSLTPCTLNSWEK